MLQNQTNSSIAVFVFIMHCFLLIKVNIGMNLSQENTKKCDENMKFWLYVTVLCHIIVII
ncbi:hypothetical protein ACI8B_50376 [Acinetobacter proteolyticus]|uniref:Uncharacterized protein n=1 Tax=Acinetobacter proteolyticus TaxID=1776741 RepID=A0A653KAU3_9GAMM|nr:hypothetical protein ACI8B_50376 [Acinetobacter proteolyticus]